MTSTIQLGEQLNYLIVNSDLEALLGSMEDATFEVFNTQGIYNRPDFTLDLTEEGVINDGSANLAEVQEKIEGTIRMFDNMSVVTTKEIEAIVVKQGRIFLKFKVHTGWGTECDSGGQVPSYTRYIVPINAIVDMQGSVENLFVRISESSTMSLGGSSEVLVEEL